MFPSENAYPSNMLKLFQYSPTCSLILFCIVISTCLPVRLSDELTYTSPDLLRGIFIIIHSNSISSYLNSLEMLGEDDLGLLVAAPHDMYSSC